MQITGILGVYVGRIYAVVKRRPLYVIDRVVGFPAVERDTRRLEHPMTSLSHAKAPQRSSLARLPRPIVIALALVALAALWQCWVGLWGDVSWLLTVDERWFAGERPYIDLLETNPPATLLIYAPEVALARLTGWSADSFVIGAGFVLAALALALTARILQRTQRLGDVGMIGLAAALFALLLLPGAAFMERDTIAAMFTLPYLALAVARAEGSPIERRWAALAGAGVAAMFAVKPPFALAVALPGVYALWRQGPRAALGMIEIPTAVLVFAVYFGISAFAFPAYRVNIVPELVDVYLAVRQGALDLLFNESGRDFFLLMILGLFLVRREFARSELAVSALAALGAFLGYLIQGKGWLYQAYPAFAFATIFAGLAWERTGTRKLDIGLGVFALLVSFVIGLFVQRWGVAISLATVGAFALRREFGAEALARFGAAATVGACAAAFAPGPLPAEALGRALAQIKPHPTVMAITESFGYVHPMVRRVGAFWVQSEPSLLIASGARLLMDEHPGDAALAAKLTPYFERDIALLVQDIATKRPDAIIVGPLNTRFHRDVWANPAVQVAMRGYRLVATNDRPEYPGELWARREDPP